MPFSGSGTGIQNADDVFFSSLSDGETLQFDSATAKWNNADPSNHTHVSDDISDSTAAGRALLIAADSAVQRAAMGAGDMSTIDYQIPPRIYADSATTFPARASRIPSGYSGPVQYVSLAYENHPAPTDSVTGDEHLYRGLPL